jgi:8-oxo-dGTP diphosphatase
MMENERRYFVATKTVLMRPDGMMLTMLRGATAPTNALRWDLPGGIVEWGEPLEDGLRRETREETGLELDDLRPLYARSRVNEINEFWTTIYYIARPLPGDVEISWEHEEFQWVTPETFLTLDSSEGNKEAVKRFLALSEAGRL